MAGSAKPDQKMKEAQFKYIRGSGSQGAQASGLFNGVTINQWNTAHVMYWSDSSHYVEFQVSTRFNIWRTGTTTWSNYTASLIIKKYNEQSGQYDDVTSNYPQTVSDIPHNKWEKTISNLPRGQYRMEYGNGLRLDSEWFLESVNSTKSLIIHDSEYKKFNPAVPGKDPTINTIPHMTSNTAPTGNVTARGAYTPAWQAFDRNNGTYWYDNGSNASNPTWLQYEFDSPRIINKITLQCATVITSGAFGIKEFTLLGSYDGVSYDKLLSVNNHPNSSDKLTYTFDNNNKYFFYKLLFGASYYGYYALVSSFEMYEAATEDIPAHWSIISPTLPTSAEFLKQGMDNLSILFEQKLVTAKPNPMIEKNGIINEGEEGKVFSYSLNLKRLIDIRSIKNEVM